MSRTGKKVGQYVQKFANMLTGRDAVARLIFRRFKGDKILKAVQQGSPRLGEDAVDKVVLRVNPAQVTFSKRKVIQKVQTSAPGRFVVFDWGSELTLLNIQGNTGNLLPEFITDGGPNPLTNLLQDTMGAVDPAAAATAATNPATETLNVVGSTLQSVMMNSMTYMELLNASPKYKTFKKLEAMFDQADADRDIITLEMGENTYRGFFEDFTFDVVAESPWNWKYSITFTLLYDLAEAVRRFDDQYKESSFIVSESDVE
jgi:hypothetical protein